ncbi:MAG TPA: murein biosynthesis integral membrane protein MurJ [Kofleriaceae bacterium]|nr:murein biosynthesis integral membrane protein MurJ [Kofleriaceae bacterium]
MKPRRGGAVAVATGIFLSRIAGLARERAIAYYMGNSPAAGAFRAALRIPNFLQNLLGEGVLSASFIPVYAKLLAQGRDDDAHKVARAVGTLLALVACALSLLGVLASRWLVDVVAPGFHGEARELTIDLVRIAFPGMALLVMSAWCLGVLNSNRKFFLSYVSPVVWNAAIIAAVIAAGRRAMGGDDIAIWLAYGAVIGSGLQFLVQVPTVASLLRSLRPSLEVKHEGVQATLRAFGPVLVGRGSVQLSSYIDQLLASYLGPPTVAAIGYASIIALLPVSLFGMAVSAAELPEMSGTLGDAQEVAAKLRDRLRGSLRQIVFLVVPSAVAFVAIGAPIIALLFQTGRFGAEDTRVVWIILAGSAIGLSAQTQGRLLGSAFYAMGDPKPPLRAAMIRVAITAGVGWALVLPIRDALGYDEAWGAFGLTASAGVAAWIEFLLLKTWLARKIGAVPIPAKLGFACLAIASIAGALGGGAYWLLTAHMHVRAVIAALAAVPIYGAVYLGVAAAAKIPEASGFVRRFTRRRR